MIFLFIIKVQFLHGQSMLNDHIGLYSNINSIVYIIGKTGTIIQICKIGLVYCTSNYQVAMGTH